MSLPKRAYLALYPHQAERKRLRETAQTGIARQHLDQGFRGNKRFRNMFQLIGCLEQKRILPKKCGPAGKADRTE